MTRTCAGGLAGSRTMGDDNWAVGFRGRVSYRGNGDYRNDYSVFTNTAFSSTTRISSASAPRSAAAVIRKDRCVPEPHHGRRQRRLDPRAEDQATFSLTGHGGRNYATNRPDGDSTIYGGSLTWTTRFRTSSAGTSSGWERDNFKTDAFHFHPDEDDTAILRREDNLYQFGTSLVWTFGPGWTFRPEVRLHPRREQLSELQLQLTEYRIHVRKGY